MKKYINDIYMKAANRLKAIHSSAEYNPEV